MYPVKVDWWNWCVEKFQEHPEVVAATASLEHETDEAIYGPKFSEAYRVAAYAEVSKFLLEHCLCMDDADLPELEEC